MATRRTTELRYTAPGSEETRRRIEQIGEAGERAGRRVHRGAGQASAGLKAVNAGSREVQAGLGNLAASAGPAGRVLAGLGPQGAAAAAGIAVVTLGMTASIRAAEQYERQMLTIEGVLRATGSASGQTGDEINRLAREIGLATLASTGQVREAAAQLLTFRSVAGDTFGRTLSLSQDLAALGFGSISSAARQLGRALEDPQQGLTLLRRVGVSFTQAQQDLIKSLNETGRSAEAQTLILDELERQVGGTGVAAAAGLSGATDSLSENWTRLLENLGNSGPGQIAADMLRGISDAIAGINDTLEETPLDRLNALFAAGQTGVAQGASAALLSGLGETEDNIGVLQREAFGDIEADLFSRAAAENAANAAAAAREIDSLTASVLGFREQADPAVKAARELATAQEVLARAVAAGVLTAEDAAAIEATLAGRLTATSKAAERLARQREQSIGSLRFEVERLGALAAAHGDGAAAIAAAAAETEALTLARRLGLATGDAELEQIRELIGERDRLNTGIEAATEAEEARQAAMEDARRAAEENFQAIVDFGRDRFTGWFDDLASDWDGLWGDLGRVALRALAQIAAQAAATVIAPQLGFTGGGLPGLGGGGFGGFGGGLGGSGFDIFGGALGGGGGLDAFGAEFLGLSTGGHTFTGAPIAGATLTGILAAAGLGFAGGGILAGLTGGNELGGSIGGGAGAAIGFAVGGPVGALIGGALGGLGGGLFGGGSSTEFNSVGVDLSTGAVTQGTSEIRSGAGEQNAALARQLGETFANQIAPAVLAAIGGALPAGTGTFFGVSTHGVQTGGFGGPATGFGLTPNQALAEATRRLVGIAEGVSDELRAAVAASTATTAEGLVSDIDFARFILGEDEPANLSDVIDAAAAEFEAMAERAAGLGLDMALAGAAIAGAQQDFVDGLLGGIEAFQQSLSIGAFAPGSPVERFGIAQGLFGELTGSALSGDLAAIAAFPAAAQQFLGLAQSVFASGPEFAALFADVNRTLNTILDIPSFAHGTGSAPSGLALVGERGPEIVNFRGGEQVIDAGRTRTAFAGGGLGGADGATAALGQLVDLAQARLEVDERSDARLARIEGEQIKLNRRLDRLAGGAG